MAPFPRMLLGVVSCPSRRRNNIEVATDPSHLALAYPRLDVHDLMSFLGKYRDISLAAKIRNTVGDEVPQIDPARVAAILKRLKQQAQ